MFKAKEIRKFKIKKLLAIIVILFICASITACSNNQSGDASVDTETGSEGNLVSNIYIEADPGKYVKLPEGYLEYTFEQPTVNITDEMIDNNITLRLRETGQDTLNNEGETKNGDKLEITYVAKNSKGETVHTISDPYKITLGEGYLSETLNDALLGHKVGDVVTVTETVSEDFTYAEELQGESITYEITIVNKYDVLIPELDDEWVKANTDFSSVDEFRESVKQELFDSYSVAAVEETFSKYWDDLVQNSEKIADFPEEIINNEIDYFHDYILSYGYNDEDLDIYAASAEYAEEAAKMKMVLYEVAAENDLIPTEEEFKEYCAEEIKTYGYDEEGFQSAFGSSSYEYGLEYGWIEEYLNDKLKDMIVG